MDLVPLSSLISNRHRDSLPRAKRVQMVELAIGFLRVGVPDYPERAFREAVANALIHRDYTRLGAVHAQWYEDRIEVSNPGGFPEGVRPDNLLVAPPPVRATHCWPMLSSGPASWNGPGAGLIRSLMRGLIMDRARKYERARNFMSALVNGTDVKIGV